MKGIARSSRYGLKTVVIVGAAAFLTGCSGGGSKPSDTTGGGGGGGGGPDELASLRARIDTLEAYRARNASFVEKLSNSYSHFYYCDVTTSHKDPTKCAPMQSHVPPPSNPPK